MQPLYTFRSRETRIERTCPLSWSWEADLSPISDDYTPDEIDAKSLFTMWATRIEKRSDYDGWVRIAWFVDGSAGAVFESAPFDPEASRNLGDFLTFYTWPINIESRQRLNWFRLPVQNGHWNANRATKGGFVQEATGFKPAPFQDRVYLPTLRAASGLGPWAPVQ
jgi:hypothetical protein